MTEITQADRDAAAEHIPAMGMANSVLNGKSDNHTLVRAFVNHRKTAAAEERAKIVEWLRKENGRCDCFAYEDNECACGGRDEYKIWPLEQTANYLERGEHLK